MITFFQFLPSLGVNPAFGHNAHVNGLCFPFRQHDTTSFPCKLSVSLESVLFHAFYIGYALGLFTGLQLEFVAPDILKNWF